MAVALSLVLAESNRLRYLYTWDGVGTSQVLLSCSGAASPDLQTDSLYGPLKQIALAKTNGLGLLTPWTAITAPLLAPRALWLADSSDTVLGNGKVPRAVCRGTLRTTTGTLTNPEITIDANYDGSGNPQLVIALQGNAIGGVSASAYIDVQVQGEIASWN